MIVWAIWQILRIILITKKQEIAKQNAMTLINFENIVVDTEFGGMTNRSIHLADQDFPQMSSLSDSTETNKYPPRRSSLTRAKAGAQPTTQSDQLPDIEMQDIKTKLNDDSLYGEEEFDYKNANVK